MSPEQQLLCQVVDLLAAGQDEVILSPFSTNRPHPRQLVRTFRISLLYTLSADALFQDSEGLILCRLVNFNLFIVINDPAQPIVWHFADYKGWLDLITAADNLDPSQILPGQGFQNRPENSASRMLTRGTAYI